MGKKKDKKKGKGAEKTALKTERNADKKMKKLLKEKGEDDIETLIEHQVKNTKSAITVEEKCEPPSPRCNISLTAHPDKEELVMFGGEFCSGKQTVVYNDLFFFNIKSHKWSMLKTEEQPPPRCGHQAAAMRQCGGQLWVFGGEFASPSQSQFHHYKDLWLYQFTEKKWEKISAVNGPSARSGHRMAACKKLLFIFGGFHDNTRDYKYFNDIHAFNTETFTWSEIIPNGSAPSPRSACVMSATQDQNHIVIYGGYSKERIKKDVDKGKIHVDMFRLSPEGKSKDLLKATWKWTQMKQSGVRPSPRCGCSYVATPGNRMIVFGGVYDEEEDEELTGTFYNDMHSVELDNGKWHEVFLRGKKDSNPEKKKRRNKKQKLETNETDEANSDISDIEVDETIENLKLSATNSEKSLSKTDSERTPQSSTMTEDIFTVTVGKVQTSADTAAGSNIQQALTSDNLFWPCKRMNTALAVKNGILFLYGGITEDGDKQLTFSDFYTLDLHKLDEWRTLIVNDISKMVWEESSDDSSDSDDSDEDEDMAATGGKRKYSDSDDSYSDDDDDMDLDNPPAVKEGESTNDFFSRTKDYWMTAADEIAEKEKLDVTTKQLKKAAFKMAEEFMTKKK